VSDNIHNFKVIPQYERYYNEDTCWGCYNCTTKNQVPQFDIVKDPLSEENETKILTLAGRMQKLYLGSEYQVEAKLVFNSKYQAWNYEPVLVKTIKPNSIESQQKFLESIITKKQSETLLAAYPNIVENVMNGLDIIDYSKTKGIRETTWLNIREKIIDNYVISDILTLLQPLGVTYSMIKKLISNEKNPELLKKKLIENPYELTKIHGLGFKKVDELALKLNPQLRQSNQRTYAFLRYYFISIGDSVGHTWVDMDTLESAVRDNIYECEENFENILELERKHKSMLYFEDEKVGLSKYYNIEKSIFEILQFLDKQIRKWKLDIENGIKIAEAEQGFNLTQEQIDVVKRAIESNVVVISGKAGCGKSTLLRALLKIYKNYSIGCCALSAKAAQRIFEATGVPSSTIHRLLKADGVDTFSYNYENPLPYDVVVLDESSMVNAKLFYDLLSAIKPTSKIILCGDHKQLPPIGYANVFSDLLQMKELFNINELTKVMRQAEKSGILSDANKIREGINPIEQPELKIVNGELKDMYYMFRDSRDALNNIAIKTYIKTIETDSIEETVLVVPRRKECLNSAQELNIQIQDLIIKGKVPIIKRGTMKFKEGARVIQVANDYEKNVFNGDLGYLVKIYPETHNHHHAFDVDFNGKIISYSKSEINQIDLAYALTCHKLQGSGYKNVIGIIDATHYTLLDSCMLYTMITRAKTKCLLLAEPSAFKKCIQNNKGISRQTWLKNFNNYKNKIVDF